MSDGSVDKVLVERGGQYELVDPKQLEAEATIVRLQNQVNPENTPRTPTTNNSPPNAPSQTPQRRTSESGSISEQQQPTRPQSTKSVSTSALMSVSLNSDPYKGFERSNRPRSGKRPKSAQASPSKRETSDKEAIEKREMADAAFEHWKKQKDRELVRRKREQHKLDQVKEVWSSKGDGDSDAFKKWLQNKSRQKSEERQVERIRAKLITVELLNVNYSECESAYERWLKQKNQEKILEKKEKTRRTNENREHMKTVLQNLKTRWNIDYNRSHYLHPNTIRSWDSLYS